MSGEDLAGFGQADTARGSCDQRRTGICFEPLDLHADGRLGAGEPRGSGRDRAGIGHREKGPHEMGVEIPFHKSPLYPSNYYHTSEWGGNSRHSQPPQARRSEPVSRMQDRFRELGLDWPTISKADLPFAPAVRIGDIVYISGQIPEVGDEIRFMGKVGADIDLQRAQKAAAVCAANVLYWLDSEIEGDLSRIVRIAKATIYVNAVDGFAQFSEVGNG